MCIRDSPWSYGHTPPYFFPYAQNSPNFWVWGKKFPPLCPIIKTNHKNIQNNRPERLTWDGQGQGTVSYTHLDVYKRQVDSTPIVLQICTPLQVVAPFIILVVFYRIICYNKTIPKEGVDSMRYIISGKNIDITPGLKLSLIHI